MNRIEEIREEAKRARDDEAKPFGYVFPVRVIDELLEHIDRLHEALAWAEPRASRGVDHACAECGGSIPELGFRCMAHKARALLAGQVSADE